MDNKLLVDVVMLPGQNIGRKKGELALTVMGTLFISDETVSRTMHKPQHLYFTSSREIKEGDWSYSKLHAQITKWGKYKVPADSVRIEATTDPSLGLPLIPTKWIEEVYVPSQGKIKQIFLESTTLLNTALKISGFSEVIILPIKDSWNREEHKKSLRDFANYMESGKVQSFRGLYTTRPLVEQDWHPINEIIDEWFDKNY